MEHNDRIQQKSDRGSDNTQTVYTLCKNDNDYKWHEKKC